jgi:hypothetical protein
MARRAFHVVCRDCTHERVTESQDEAALSASRHADDTGHDTIYARIT